MLISSDANKQKYLIESLVKNIDREKIFSLYLVSCYLNLKSVNYLIYELKKYVILSNIWILIDREESIRIGKEALMEWKKNMESHQLKTDLKIVDSEDLFHVKAYYLVENKSQGLKPCSNLVIGSANLTKKGITDIKGNTELLSHISDVNLHEEFNKKIQEIMNQSFTIDLSEIDNFNNDSERHKRYLKFHLITNGYFIKHLDKNTKTGLLDITYKFDKNYRNPDDKGEGNLKDTREYFNKQNIEEIFKQYNQFYDVHWRDYAIKTVFGHWIPKYLVEYLNEWDNSAYRKEYRKEIDNFWKDNAPEIREKICNHILEFISKKWLKEEWFKQTIGKRKYEDILEQYGMQNITNDCSINETLKNRISKIFTNIIMDKIKEKLDKNEKNLVLKYSVYEPTDFIDISYTKIINTLYKELCNSQNSKKNIPNKNYKISWLIKANEGNLDLIKETLKPDDFLKSSVDQCKKLD